MIEVQTIKIQIQMGKKQIKLLVKAWNSFGSNKKESERNICLLKDKSDRPYFKLSVETPFTEDEIIDFVLLTGKKQPELDRLLKHYANNGIHSLWQINQLIKMGHYCG